MPWRRGKESRLMVQPGSGAGSRGAQGKLYFSPIAKLRGMGEYNTREAKVEQELP